MLLFDVYLNHYLGEINFLVSSLIKLLYCVPKVRNQNTLCHARVWMHALLRSPMSPWCCWEGDGA